MSDLEKVIHGLECCIVNEIDGHARCSQCPYDATCVSGLMRDTLELLKEKLPIKPNEFDPVICGCRYTCGACRHKLVWKMNFCPTCGRKVKWDD